MTPEQPFASPTPGVPPTMPPAPDPMMPAANPYGQASAVPPINANPAQPVAAQPFPMNPAMPARPVAPTQPMPVQPMMGAQPMPVATQPIPADPAMPTQPMGAVLMEPVVPVEPAMPVQPMGAVPMEQPVEPMMGAQPMMAEEPAQAKPSPADTAPVVTQGPTTQAPEPIAAAPDATPPMGMPSATAPKKGKGLIIGIIAGVLAVVGIIVAVILLMSGAAANVEILEEKSFFLPDGDPENTSSKYALFNENGDRLTEFEYTSASVMVGGYSAVVTTDREEGIINAKGKTTVGFGKYNTIISYGGLYVGSNDSGRVLMTATGKKVSDLEEMDKVLAVSESYFSIVRHTEGKNEIYDIKGNKVMDFNTTEDIETSLLADTVTVSYKGGLIVLNNKELKLVGKYDSGEMYHASSISDSGNSIILVVGGEGSDFSKYALFRDGKVTDYSDKCRRVYFGELYKDGKSVASDQVYCTDSDYNARLVLSSGEVDSKDPNANHAFSDTEYVNVDKVNAKVNFYKDGKAVKTISGSYMSVATHGDYVSIRNYSGGSAKVTLYDKNGNEIFSKTNVSSIDGLDMNENAVLYEYSNGNSVEYLVNKSGEKISKDYYYISAMRNGYYRAVVGNSSNGKAALLDKNGKELVPANKYTRYEFGEENNVLFGIASENNYDLLDSEYKVVAELSGDYILNVDPYIVVKRGNSRQYYSLSGKKIHEYGV